MNIHKYKHENILTCVSPNNMLLLARVTCIPIWKTQIWQRHFLGQLTPSGLRVTVLLTLLTPELEEWKTFHGFANFFSFVLAFLQKQLLMFILVYISAFYSFYFYWLHFIHAFLQFNSLPVMKTVTWTLVFTKLVPA